MADVADVSSVLVGIISGLLYPNGTSLPPIVTPNVRVYVGWPVPEQLDADLRNVVGAVPTPICHVSVYPLATEKNTTRYAQQWQTAIINIPTLNLLASGQTVTVGGTIPMPNNPHNAVVFVNNVPYVYAVQAADSLRTIATALATLIGQGATSAGAVITLPAGVRLGAVRIGVTGTSVLEIARQQKLFQITVWADSPHNRTAIAKVIDPALKSLTFINLPDYTAGRIRYATNRESDNAEKQNVYRRDLMFNVEYATTLLETNTTITQEQLNISVEAGGAPPPVSIDTLYL